MGDYLDRVVREVVECSNYPPCTKMILDNSRLVAPASLFNNIRFELPLEVYLK